MSMSNKRKICSWCNNCNNEDFDDNEVYLGTDGKWYIGIKGDSWNYYDDRFDYYSIQIRYCPWCGRKLK